MPRGLARALATLLGVIALCGVPSATPAGSCAREVVGYYPSWGRYQPFLPADADWSRITVASHAFLEVLADGSLREDADYAATRPLLIAAAHAAGARVLAAVGGWGGCTGKRLQTVAADPALRSALAANLTDYCLAHGYDGIAMDWEFPGASWSDEPQCTLLSKDPARCAADRSALSLLSAEIRARFDAAVPALRLHIAVPMASWWGECFDAASLSGSYDLVEVMAYDMHGTWAGHSGHNAHVVEPSHDPHGGVLSVVSALDYWTVTRAVPAGKIVLGVPFFGYVYPGACGLGSTNLTGAFQIPYRILARDYVAHGWTSFEDQEAGVPYLLRDTGCGVASYDHPASIADKADLAVSRGLAGVMIWDLSQDHDAVSGGAPLLESLGASFCCTPEPACCASFPGYDCDGDGVVSAEDCLPADPGAFAAPGAVRDLRVARSGPSALFSWSDASEETGSGTVYDVIRGFLPIDPGAPPVTECVVIGAGAPDAEDPSVPSGGFFYLVRARNACGTGPYGDAAGSAIDPCGP